MRFPFCLYRERVSFHCRLAAANLQVWPLCQVPLQVSQLSNRLLAWRVYCLYHLGKVRRPSLRLFELPHLLDILPRCCRCQAPHPVLQRPHGLQ